MTAGRVDPEELPQALKRCIARYPEVWERFKQLGSECYSAGPLDDRQLRLLKLAVAIGGRLEGAVRSHARRALEEGVSEEELYHTALMALTTAGLPTAVAAMSWIDDVVDRHAVGGG